MSLPFDKSYPPCDGDCDNCSLDCDSVREDYPISLLVSDCLRAILKKDEFDIEDIKFRVEGHGFYALQLGNTTYRFDLEKPTTDKYCLWIYRNKPIKEIYNTNDFRPTTFTEFTDNIKLLNTLMQLINNHLCKRHLLPFVDYLDSSYEMAKIITNVFCLRPFDSDTLKFLKITDNTYCLIFKGISLTTFDLTPIDGKYVLRIYYGFDRYEDIPAYESPAHILEFRDYKLLLEEIMYAITENLRWKWWKNSNESTP